jgi:hypothetical protein
VGNSVCKSKKSKDRVSQFSDTSGTKPVPAAPLSSSPGPSYDLIASLLREHFDKSRDDAFAVRVLKALDGAPVTMLAAVVPDEIRAMREKGKVVTTGILLFFAGRVAARWREMQAEGAATPAAPPKPPRAKTEREQILEKLRESFAGEEIANG